MPDKEDDLQQEGISGDELMELVKLFEGFNEASASFAKTYRGLEDRIARLSAQLEEQSRLLRRTEGFLASVLGNVPVGLLVINLDGRITLFNDYAEKLTGIKRDDCIGKRYAEVFEVDALAPESVLFTLNNGSILESHERTMRIKGAEQHPVRFSTNWIHDESDNRTSVLEVFEDLRPLRELQNRIAHSANLASLGEMAAQVAHELRNPLAGVQGFVQFLQEDIADDDPSRMTIEKIISGVRDIDRIASRLLEFTSPVDLTFDSADLHQILRDQYDMIVAETHHSNANIDIILSLPEENVEFEVDPMLLKQAILNLLKNATNACEDGDQIEIGMRWRLLNNTVQIFVRDTGTGITQANLEKIFYPFFTTRSRGTGLGLSMVKKIIEAHGGTIIVRSEIGAGSIFKIELPIKR